MGKTLFMKACIRCGRLIKDGNYCLECSLTANGLQHRCTFCKNDIRMNKMFYNKKTNKFYCEKCLNNFTLKLYEKGIPDEAIVDIIRKDFTEIK